MKAFAVFWQRFRMGCTAYYKKYNLTLLQLFEFRVSFNSMKKIKYNKFFLKVEVF